MIKKENERITVTLPRWMVGEIDAAVRTCSELTRSRIVLAALSLLMKETNEEEKKP